MEEKTALRRSFLIQRQSLPEETREQLSWLVEKHLWTYLGCFQSLLGYWPIRGEVDTVHFMKRWLLEKKRLFLPRVRDKNIEVVEIKGIEEMIQKGYGGIPEPLGERTNTYPEVVLVPGIVFDVQGYRLGYGAGFYDRFLAGGFFKETIGVAYRFQIVNALPHGERDVPVKRLVCEEGWIL